MAAVIVVIGKSYKSNLPFSTISPINFGTIFGARKLFSKKIPSRGKCSVYYASRVLYIALYPTNSEIFGTKHLLCRRFLQHYYRACHQSPPKAQINDIDRLVCSMLALIPQSGNSSGAALGVRSVALLQVA